MFFRLNIFIYIIKPFNRKWCWIKPMGIQEVWVLAWIISTNYEWLCPP